MKRKGIILLFESYMMLLGEAMLPVLLSLILFLVQKKGKHFNRLSYFWQQFIIGVLFSGLAILGTEKGININGAVVNVRDSAPVCAGLFFGGPAGIIAGIIGGAERWLSVIWNGSGAYSRLACSISTFLAGVIAAFLRKFMFAQKHPRPVFAFVIGGITEVIHLTVLLITKLTNSAQAFDILKICYIPMILFNALSVMMTAIILAIINRDLFRRKEEKASLTDHIQNWLLLSVTVACLCATTFVYALSTNAAKSDCSDLLESNIDDFADQLAWSSDIAFTEQRHIGNTGFILVINSEGNVNNVGPYFGMRYYEEGYSIDGLSENEIEKTEFKIGNHNESAQFFRMYRTVTDRVNDYSYTVIAYQTVEEAMIQRDHSLFINCFIILIIFAFLFCMIYNLIKRLVVNRIRSVNSKLQKITDGDLSVKIEDNSSLEFELLSRDINSSVTTLKHYIDEAAERLTKELQFAKSIQYSSLPSVFPAYPNIRSFDIYATMDTAQEVGGDFYDFYMLDPDHLIMLIADVSGKGIPAALFMMKAKTMLKNFTESGLSISEAFERANEQLCIGNDAGMFVTAWMGMLTLSSGRLDFVSAGHNPPIVCRNGSGFDYLTERAGFILAGMDGVKYKSHSIDLAPGEKIYLYTDGVTEATSADKQFYGEDRLLRCINALKDCGPVDMLHGIKKDIDSFVGDAEQFDDITMVTVHYYGDSKEEQ
ncbi:MAG: SpoIIE family protein phosphatase [Firmicutes bacterium]|nr:SpoIIE family protein phosphatase [Candidatus Colimorpha enterica]